MRALMFEAGEVSRRWVFWARLMEILPGLSIWLFLLSPIVLSFVQPTWVAYLIIGYDLIWLTKIIGNGVRQIRGYNRMVRVSKAPWHERLADLNDLTEALDRPKSTKTKGLNFGRRLEQREYRRLLKHTLADEVAVLDPTQIYHAVIIATFNEELDVLEPTVESLLKTKHDLSKIWLFIAYEERGGPNTASHANYLIKQYGKHFGYAVAIKHPADMPGEAMAKAGNITFAARQLTSYAKQRQIDPERVIVTTLDSDNRPAPQYFSHLTFVYATTASRTHKSYQPIPLFLNNIWDVPAAMRVVATWNSFWIMSEAVRPHRLRNFSSHAQSLQTLIDTDYWNVKSIVEDGHQFWRTYYTYHGDHQTLPIYIPVYQDAVLTNKYFRTFRAQFVQLRRWAWGGSDISFVFVQNLRHKEISWTSKWWYFFRLYEGFFTWATASLILAFAGWAPLFLNKQFGNYTLAHELPVFVSRLQTFTSIGIIITVIISLASLPPRPARYRRHKHVMMILQWALLPFVAIFIHSMAALNAQTRLMFGRYLEKFDVTEKAVVGSVKSKEAKP